MIFITAITLYQENHLLEKRIKKSEGPQQEGGAAKSAREPKGQDKKNPFAHSTETPCDKRTPLLPLWVPTSSQKRLALYAERKR